MLLIAACQKGENADRFTLNYFFEYTIKRPNEIRTIDVSTKGVPFGFEDTKTRIFLNSPYFTINEYNYTGPEIFQMSLDKRMNIYEIKTPFLGQVKSFKNIESIAVNDSLADTLSISCLSLEYIAIQQAGNDSFYHMVNHITKDKDNIAILEGSFRIKCLQKVDSGVVYVEGNYRAPFYTKYR